MRLTPTQINALRLAAETPSCLGQGQYFRPTELALERMGLIERDGGSWPSGDCHETPLWLITDAGRKALAESRK